MASDPPYWKDQVPPAGLELGGLKLPPLVEDPPSDSGGSGERESLSEATSLTKTTDEEDLRRQRQDQEERTVYAKRIFVLTCSWLAAIVSLLLLQGFLGPFGWFSLADSTQIAVATTTAASVTALLIVVMRY